MATFRTHFDGERIIVPPELHGAAPGDVLIVYLPDSASKPVPRAGGSSFWDFVGKAECQRSAADIDAQVREERDGWGER